MGLHVRRISRKLVCVLFIVFGAGIYLKQIMKDVSESFNDPVKVLITANPVLWTGRVHKNTTHWTPTTRFPSVPTDDYTVHRRFVEMKFGGVYIFGVVAGNSSAHASWDLVKIYGGIDLKLFRNAQIGCCFAYKENGKMSLIEVKPVKIRPFQARTKIWSIHVTCYNRKPQLFLIGAALTANEHNCNLSDVRYVTPVYPLREASEKIAIGTKTAYGNVSAELIIEWMEAWRYIGVDKVVVYYIDSLNDKALKVLQYYASIGIVDLYFYEPAASEKYPRDTYNDHAQRQNDQQIVVDDSFERMSGYRYFGIFDFDEFLTLIVGNSLKEMMGTFFERHLDATGISFMSQYYFLSWGKSGNISELILGSYIQRNKPKLDSVKNLYMPDRVEIAGVDTHVIKAKPGFKMYRPIIPCYGLVHHYRYCRTKKLKACMTEYDRIVDSTIAKWSLNFQKNVLAVRQTVFGSETTP